MKRESQGRIPVRIRIEDEKGFEKTIVFKQGLLRVGSEPGSGLRLDHESVAPCHLLILREGERFTFADTSAGMTTLVNGSPAHKGVLQHGDIITFGQGCPYRLTFLVDSSRTGDLREKKLRGLLSACRAINSSLVLDEVLSRVMDAALQVTGAEKGFLLMIEQDGSLNPAVYRNIDEARLRGETIPASLSLIRKAIRSKRSVHFVPGDPEAMGEPGSASIVRLKLQTVMCTPILSRGEPAGILYVDHRGTLEGALSEDLEILEALADQASVAIENARLSEQRVMTERLSAVGRMVSSIVHDLNGPITGIQASLHLIRRDPAGPRAGELLDLIGEEAARMVGMTREVLDYCRGRIEVRAEPIPLRLFLGRVARAVSAEMNARSIRVLVAIREDVTMMLDTERMERVFRNFLRNAAEAMPEGGEVRIGGAVAGDRLVISIADTGCGMSEEVRQRAFEPFYTSGKEGGSGLGMAIAASIISAHGGAVEIDSTPGQGTTIRVLLPLDGAGSRSREEAGAREPHAALSSSTR